MNANRDTTVHPDPVSLPTPWAVQQHADVTAEERVALRAELAARSALTN